MTMQVSGAKAKQWFGLSALLITTVMAITGCEKKPEPVAAPPPEVTVAEPLKQAVVNYLEFTGSLEGSETVEIRARVKGYLQAINAKPGSAVKAGDILFTIDPAPYKAVMLERQSSLKAVQAKANNAAINYKRMQTAFDKGAIARIELDRRIAERDVTASEVAQAKAAVESAQLDLDYTRVTAPIDGRIGLQKVDVGALVGASDPTLLTTLVSGNDLKVKFDMSETQLQGLLTLLRERAAKSGRTLREEASEMPIELAMGDSGAFEFTGKLLNADNALNVSTGTMKVEASFANPDKKLIPGAFVRLRLPLGDRQGLLVPEVAINRDQVGPFLLLVGMDNKVMRRDVVLGRKDGQLMQIDKGLDGNERVIVNGLQRARVGSNVTAVEQSTSQ
jgi:RND family efflux transporter MFP subunit